MAQLMFGQTLGGNEALSASLTLIGLVMIYLLMILKFTNPRETFPTVATLEKAALDMS